MSWLSPPTHADEESTRVARVIHVIGIGIIVAVLPAIVHNLGAHRLYSVMALFIEEMFAIACLVLNRQGKVKLASRLLSLSAVALSAVLQWVGGEGVHDVAVLIYPCVLIVAGALFDRRWFIFFTLLAMAALALQYAIELAGLVTYPLSHHTEIRQLIDAEVILAVSAVGVGLLMGGLRRNMVRAHAAVVSLQESENLYRSLFESVNEAILVMAPGNGRIVDANHRASEWFGHSVEKLRTLTATDLNSNAPGYTEEESRARMNLTVKGQPQLFEWQSRASDGHLFWVEVNMLAALVGGEQRILISMRDIDERRRAAVEKQRLEERLRQSQKLESIGRLASGVAHDFNNLLTCVLGNVDLAMSMTTAAHPILENLEEIRHAARRAAELTGQLLAFSRKQPIAPIPLDLRDVLGGVDRMLRRLLGETVALVTDVAPDIGRIRADPGQLEQILVNLAVNARDAMPGGGRLTIMARNAILDGSFCAANPGARAGQFAHIGISDTGTGMGEELRQHIFEPFFTTKAQGKGTGLGLAMVFGAMEQNQGFIILTSEPGQGSTFDLYFPILHGRVEATVAKTKTASLPTGSERVLLVEDDAAVRNLSERVLRQLGYQVVVCETGVEAIAAGLGGGRPFDLLVTDLILPGIDGRTLANQLRGMQPRLRVLYCSGYMEDASAHRGVIDTGLAFLAKPFTVEELARKARDVLDEPAAPGDG